MTCGLVEMMYTAEEIHTCIPPGMICEAAGYLHRFRHGLEPTLSVRGGVNKIDVTVPLDRRIVEYRKLRVNASGVRIKRRKRRVSPANVKPFQSYENTGIPRASCIRIGVGGGRIDYFVVGG